MKKKLRRLDINPNENSLYLEQVEFEVNQYLVDISKERKLEDQDILDATNLAMKLLGTDDSNMEVHMGFDNHRGFVIDI